MDIKQNVIDHIRSKKSLLLSTFNSDGSTNLSYAPYYFDPLHQHFFVLLSGLSQHTGNLIANPNASILIIDDESETDQIFARKRLSYQVVTEQLKDEMEHDVAAGAMLEKFGDIISMLTSLPDFSFFVITPMNGLYIEGFGKAFNIQHGLVDGIAPAMEAKNR